ncbi:hypothetical protein [Streptomyces sp. NPDC088557]|uniref:hypothetical protein n=1 Tax=Streptomyces sp. NPDC088557 TaxID=3365867 RepID=UPI0037FD9414
MTTIPDDVPLAPVYTITLTPTGAYIDGGPVPGSSSDPDESRLAALREIHVKAAFHGRPVRFVAKEADGTTWPMIMDTAGNAFTLHTPHPTPPPAPAAPPPPATGTPDWHAPLPPECHPVYTRLRDAEAAGDLPGAVALAARLTDDLSARYGPLHPHAVNMLTVHASLTLRHGDDWYETTDLLTRTAQRRHEAHAHPEQDTVHAARNAHAAWRTLTTQDPEGAAELAPALAGVLDQLGEDRRVRDVVAWAERDRSR